MSRRERSGVSCIGCFFIVLITMIVLLAAAIFGGCMYVKSQYGIDVPKTIKHIQTIASDVDTDKLYTNQFKAAQDMPSAMNEVNAKCEGLITYSETDGYKIDLENLNTGSQISSNLRLSGKQVAALINIYLGQTALDFGSAKVLVEIVQIDFSNITSSGADMNVVLCMDTNFIFDKVSGIPNSIMKKIIPEKLYVSSTVSIKKGSSAFEYTVSSKELSIGNLNNADTKELFDTINVILKVGTSAELNKRIGTQYVNALIGNSSANGFTYSLRDYGISDFNFISINSSNYYELVI